MGVSASVFDRETKVGSLQICLQAEASQVSRDSIQGEVGRLWVFTDRGRVVQHGQALRISGGIFIDAVLAVVWMSEGDAHKPVRYQLSLSSVSA